MVSKLWGRFKDFDAFPESKNLAVENKSGLGALFSVFTLALTIPYALDKIV